MFGRNGEKGISEEALIGMLDDTSKLLAAENGKRLSSAATAAQKGNALAEEVEFFKWLKRNYSPSGIFDSNVSLQNYVMQGPGKEAWMVKQIQGKGYEYDYMLAKRGNIGNIFKHYDAGDVANRAASDITEYNMLTGKSKEYQMKAYTSKTNPHLKNTPKDMTVVTNAEKVQVVSNNEYQNVEEFQNAEQIRHATDGRMKKIKDGKAYSSYQMKQVAGTMAKAGVIGCVIGIGAEAISSYKLWKVGKISDEQYLKELAKAGGNEGVTSAATAGVMIPVAAKITAFGASSLLNIPIAFVLGNTIDKVVAPCFARGKYREILNKAKYYSSLDSVYGDMYESIQKSANQYYLFVSSMGTQRSIHNSLHDKSKNLDVELKKIYDSI